MAEPSRVTYQLSSSSFDWVLGEFAINLLELSGLQHHIMLF